MKRIGIERAKDALESFSILLRIVGGETHWDRAGKRRIGIFQYPLADRGG
ncbi:MAG: hypothetical protein ANABAC_0665 [Anaerolineae bacterium]|nr:MAG: hypothetical protein ANABAC_0665 [Anaerolineae bacterium]